ncbi:Sorting nexin, cytoplasm-to-vacuole targeting pathway/endosomal sorting [Nowakowskiella sp. JEL0407]|nr:Sorting nexin, cytoplasm-to-vacuole targeting pathway/endosomal sorting [Nowakowskiella sp. JEL0407]
MPLTSSVPSTIIPEPVIKLMSAEKNHDSTGSFTTYLIHTEIPSFHIDLETKHRYSEFEAFQKYLVRSYPTVVVPPIPEKHTISDYATKQGKAKDDPVTIDKRKRMLETFLNRVAIHPVLRRDVVFHKFLEPGISWHEALTNAPLPASLINKNKSALQKLTEPRTLRNPDRQFGAAEDYTLRFSSRTSHALNVERRLVKLTQESSQTYSELGATFNAWSLSEKDLSEAIDQVGQAFDSMSTVTNQLAQAMEERMTDPLQEYVLFSKVIEKLLNWRHDRHVEFEVVTETIHNKKKTLQKLEASELEAQRLAAALRAEGTLGHRQHLPPPSISNEVPGENRGQVNQSSNIPANTFSEYYRPAITPRPQGFLATINSLIDNDPEVTRRNTISKTRVNLVSLEEQRKIALKDLQTANSEIQEDLDRFQSRKIVDFRNLFLSYAMAMKEYHRRSVLAWEEAKSAVDQISLQ